VPENIRSREIDAVTVRLRQHADISPSVCHSVERFLRTFSRHLPAGATLLHEADAGKTYVLVRGWLVREIQLEDGRSVVASLFLPGDLIDLNAYLISEVEYSICAITPALVAELSGEQFAGLTAGHPELVKALLWMELQQSSINRQWLVNLGQRSASERIAHFFYETFLRLSAVGLTDGDECEFPMTQAMLSEVAGITPVHVNRSLKLLREEGLLEFRRGRLRIHDFKGLRAHAGFDPLYLHLGKSKQRDEAGVILRTDHAARVQ
jgi:CRP-like cAMP-binding protein